MAEISKEELMAMVEVQSKTAASMESIANSMKAMAEQYKELTKGMQEGRAICRKEIQSDFHQDLKLALQPLNNCATMLEKTYDSVKTAKIFIGIVTLVIIVVTVLMNVMRGPTMNKKDLAELLHAVHQVEIQSRAH